MAGKGLSIKVCSLLQLLCTLIGKQPANGYYSYTNRYASWYGRCENL